MPDIEIEIDGKKLTALPNQTIIQVADAAGIYIPRFCYHQNLSVPANCRMCLVEVEKAPKTLPACATPVMPGMKVFTKSEKTRLAQRAVMEFLLINHPLDCPICDQGGECELQDLSMGYSADHSRYTETKRAVADQDLGPLIATEMTRCIYCTRCVRFGDELGGMRELGAIGRGEFTEISTYVQHAIHSEVSGNIIDLCPVGALTSKPYRFQARPWELDQSPSVSPHDCFGTNVNVHTRYGKVMRVVSRENIAINETWIADRDRFSYDGLYHADRLAKPMARINGKLQEVEWEKAFEIATTRLQGMLKSAGAAEIGALANPSSTLEEFYLLQKLLRALGSPHIDHRLREIDTSDNVFPGLNMPIDAIEACEAVVIIGSNLRKELPMLALRIRKAAGKGMPVIVLNCEDYEFNFPVAHKTIVPPQQLPQAISGLKDQLADKKNICVLLGAIAAHHPQAATIRQQANTLGGTLGILSDGANGAGAWLAGAIPDEKGLSAYAMFTKPLKGYVLLNVEPEFDCANAANACKALKQASCVIALSIYKNAILEETADVIFPMAAFTETGGTFINCAQQSQSFTGMAHPYESARPAWKILRVLGNFLGVAGFDYEKVTEVRDEAQKAAAQKTMPSNFAKSAATPSQAASLMRIGEIPLYAADSIVRRSPALQATMAITDPHLSHARLHPKTAEKLNVKAGDTVEWQQQDSRLTTAILLDQRLAEDCVAIAGGISVTAHFGDLLGDIQIAGRHSMETKS